MGLVWGLARGWRGAPRLEWVAQSQSWEGCLPAWALARGWAGEKGPSRRTLSGSPSWDF